MATANEAVIQRAYDAFSTGDMEAIKDECFSPDIAWSWPGTGPLGGVQNDVDSVIGTFVRLFEDSEGTFKVSPESIAEFGDLVVVRSRAAWTGKNGSYDEPYVQVFRIANGRASECTLHFSDRAAWDQFPA